MILCSGMMNCDVTLSPVPGQIMQMDSAVINPPVMSCGGDALNTAVALGKLSKDVMIAGRIGDDASGQFLLKECRRYGVRTDGVVTDPCFPTCCSYALVDTGGERHFLSEISLYNEMNGCDVPDSLIGQADIVYVGSVLAMKKMDNGGIADIFKRAHAAGAMTGMDAAINDLEQTDPEQFLPQILEHTDFFFPSLLEASRIAGTDDISSVTEWFRNTGLKYFGIKLGGRGCYVTDFETYRFIPCPQGLPVVDTSGAGDCFMAGLLCALEEGKDFFEAARFASMIGSLSVGARGTVEGVPDRETADRRFSEWCACEDRMP